MAAVADKVVVELELRDGQYLSRVRQNERVFSQSQQRVGYSAEQAERRIRASSDGIARSFRNIATALAATVSVAAIKGMADSYIQLQNRLRVTGLEGEALANMYERLNDLANETRTETEATIQVYARLRLATEGMSFTNEEMIRTTGILNKALQASGATTQEATSSLLQFSQAIGSGILAGDELRSIRENAPLVARAIAAEFNTTIGGLKVLGEQGLLTSDRVLAGVLAAGAEVDALFARTEATVGSALTRIGNELLKYIGEADEALSASERLVAALNSMADNIDDVAAAIATIATVLAGRYAVAQGIAAAATLSHASAQIALLAAISNTSRAALLGSVAMRGLGAASLFFVTNPIGLAITAVAAAVAVLAVRANSAERKSADLAARIRETSEAAGTLAQETSSLGGDISQTQVSVAALTGEVDLLADAHYRAAAAAKAQAIELQRLRLLESRDQLNEAREAFDRRVRIEQRRARGPIGEPGSRAALAGMSAAGIDPYAVANAAILESQEYRNLRDATRNTVTLTNDLRGQMARNLETFIPDSRSGAGGGGDASGGRSASSAGERAGPSPEELAAMREEIALQGELDIARARGDEAEIRRINRLMDTRDLAERLARAEVDNAYAVAEAHVQAVAEIEDARASQIEYQERLAMISQALIDYQERENALLIDRLGYEAELARLSGDESAIEQSQRRLFIEERINELLRLRPTLSREDARAQAAVEFDALENAAEIGEASRMMARGFIDIIRSDDIGAEIGRRFQNAAFDGLENLLANAFRGILSSQGGGGFLGSIFGFGGFRAGGGPVRAGFAYDVGENGRERFIAPANGFIAPNTESVSASPSGGGMAFTFAPVYQVQGYGQDIERLKQQMAADQASFSNRVAGAVNDGYRRGKVRLARG